MWYKKRDDVTAKYVAKQCGIDDVLDMVGEIIHGDDLEKLREQLFDVSQDTVNQLFEVVEI